LKTKKHGRKEQNLFRYGLDYLTDSLLQRLQGVEDEFRLLVLFLCPPDMIQVSEQNPKIMTLDYESTAEIKFLSCTEIWRIALFGSSCLRDKFTANNVKRCD
jgi:hypothetical protein